MIILKNVLDAEALAKVRDLATKVEMVDGKATAGVIARKVKNNLQGKHGDASLKDIQGIVLKAIASHTLSQIYIRPRVFTPVMLSSYADGQEYGYHTDNAAMNDLNGKPMRTDVSFTLFLEEADSYDGGALIIRDNITEHVIKLPPGSAIVYATGDLHRVQPVTRGRRLAVVGWIESRIPTEFQRQVLYDFHRVIGHVPAGEARDLFVKALGNLERLWT